MTPNSKSCATSSMGRLDDLSSSPLKMGSPIFDVDSITTATFRLNRDEEAGQNEPP